MAEQRGQTRDGRQQAGSSLKMIETLQLANPRPADLKFHADLSARADAQ